MEKVANFKFCDMNKSSCTGSNEKVRVDVVQSNSVSCRNEWELNVYWIGSISFLSSLARSLFNPSDLENKVTITIMMLLSDTAASPHTIGLKTVRCDQHEVSSNFCKRGIVGSVCEVTTTFVVTRKFHTNSFRFDNP